MNERKRVVTLIAIMVGVVFVVAGITIGELYHTALDQERERISVTARSQARLIETVARSNITEAPPNPLLADFGPVKYTLKQLIDAHERYRGFGKTGEFTMAKRQGDSIVFLLSHRHHDLDKPKPVPFGSRLAVPMQRALSGKSGTMIGVDYRGTKVLAAYEPVSILNAGIVAKIDMAEIREPFLRASIIVVFLAILLVAAGAILFIKVTNPVLRRVAESEQNFRELFNSIRDAIVVADTNRNIININPAFTLQFGYALSELKGRKALCLYEKEEEFHRLAKLLQENDHSASILKTIQYRKKRGDVFPGETNVCFLRDRRGNLKGFIGLIRDITLREAQERALRRARDELEVRVNEKTEELQRELDLQSAYSRISSALLSPATDIPGIARIVFDEARDLTGSKHGYVSEIFPETGEMMAWALTEMKGTECRIKDQAGKRILFAKAQEGYYGLWGRSLNAREAFYTNDPENHPAYEDSLPRGHVSLERCLLAPAMIGQRTVGQIALANSERDYTDKDLENIRNLAELYAIAIDRKRSEEKLEETSRRLAYLLENSPTLLLVLKIEGDDVAPTWISGSLTRALGYTQEEMREPGWLVKNLHEEDRRQAIKRFLGLFQEGKVSHEYRFLSKDGDVIWVHEDIRLFRNEDGRALEAISAWTDITESKRAQDLFISKRAAEEANRAKSDFLAAMSHELRTPLNAVIGFSQLLMEPYFGKLEEKQAAYVKDILESGQHLLSLMNDILDIAKVESGKMELDMTAVNVKELLEGSMVMIREKAMKGSIQLHLQLPPDQRDIEITADERKLKQVMFNLLSNAVKFTGAGGEIRVRADLFDGSEHFSSRWGEGIKEGEPKSMGKGQGSSRKFVRVSVEDTGRGIDLKHQEKIFEKFYQVKDDALYEPSGTGLGLSLCKEFIEMHCGKIWVESEGEGMGSRFRFVLPFSPLETTPFDGARFQDSSLKEKEV